MHDITRRLVTFWREERGAQGPVPLHAPVFEGREWAYVKDCIDTGWVSSVGSYVDRFEAMLAEITGAAHAVATVNGTAALEMCLHLAGVKPGDGVVMPALTFVATANAASHLGAVCHFVDVEESTLGIDPAKLDAYLAGDGRGRVKAVVAMHTFGHPVALDEVAEVCGRHGVALVEDAAESLGSTYKGRHTGRHGMLAALSFNGNKIVTTGGGGAILTDDPDLARRAKHLTTTAKLPDPYRFNHDEIGWNYRLPNLNAALGCAQLEALPGYVERKRRLAARYGEILDGTGGCRMFKEPPHCRSNYWLAALLLERADRSLLDRLLDEAAAAAIQCRPVWTPMHRLPMFSGCPRGCLTVTEDLERRLLNLPVQPVAPGARRPMTFAAAPWSVFERPSFLRDSYSRLVLVSRGDQLDGETPDPATLVVACEWLAWRQCLRAGWHALHIDHPMARWPDCLGPPLEIYRRAAGWMYRDGVDPTLFLGVSIGRQFATDVGFFIHTWERFGFAIETLCRMFGVQAVELRDLRDSYDILTPETRLLLVETAAARAGASVVSRPSPGPLPAGSLHCRAIFGREPAPEKGLRPLIRTLLVAALDLACRVRLLPRRHRPRALIWTSLAVLARAVPAFAGKAVVPVVIADAAPKSPAFLSACWRNGVQLVRMPRPRLGAAERARVDAMAEDCRRAAGGDDGSPWSRAFSLFLQSRVLPRFPATAGRIKAYHRLYRRLRPARTVVADVNNSLSRIMCELSHLGGGGNDELLNGLFLVPFKNPARCGDAVIAPLVDRHLAWGEVGARWTAALETGMAVRIVGYPGLGPPAPPVPAPRPPRRVLILPLLMMLGDPTAPSAAPSSLLVECVEVLRRHGVESIRVKPHPGSHDVAYFRVLSDEMGLGVEVVSGGPLAEQLDWADLVIGPVTSTALVESLAAGKPYFPLRPRPSSVRDDLIGRLPLVAGGADLDRLLSGEAGLDVAAALDEFCATAGVADPVAAFWQAVEDGIHGAS